MCGVSLRIIYTIEYKMRRSDFFDGPFFKSKFLRSQELGSWRWLKTFRHYMTFYGKSLNPAVNFYNLIMMMMMMTIVSIRPRLRLNAILGLKEACLNADYIIISVCKFHKNRFSGHGVKHENFHICIFILYFVCIHFVGICCVIFDWVFVCVCMCVYVGLFVVFLG